MSNIQILLDCPPGIIRPNNVLENILVSTTLEVSDFEITSKCFGAWTFELSEEKRKIYEDYENLIITKIKDAYNDGLIRYAEW
jgi:dimeric dUTPase (all-alpha-NTP-PPase superfamily)